MSNPPSLPTGGQVATGLKESFELDPFTGSAGLSIALPLPQARALTPELALAYTGSGNGVFGWGFDLNLMSLRRSTKQGFPRYNQEDSFVLSGYGDLVPALSYDPKQKSWQPLKSRVQEDNQNYQVLTYRPRYEQGFPLIEQWTNTSTQIIFWKILTAENITHILGQSPQARVFDPDYPSHIFE